ncbi:MAG: hypothetical protein AAF939_12240 [Planctomycetota bacterium]
MVSDHQFDSWYGKAIYWVLVIIGVGLMTAFIPIFFPVSLMAWIHGILGLGEFPDRPITAYLARSTSLMYGIHGTLIFVATFDLKRYWPLVPVFGWLHIATGLTILGVDLSAPMPWYWIAGEGIPVASGGVLILWLYQKANQVNGPGISE